MTTEEIQKVEEQLQLKLPAYYKALQQNFPQKLIELKINLELLLNDYNRVIQINEFLKQIGALPENYFSIGEDGCGNYYYINISSEDESVYFADHEEVVTNDETSDIDWKQTLQLKHSSLNEFIDWLYELDSDFI